MQTVSTDRIEKRVTLRAPRSRVWRAISNADEFGRWFGAKLSGTIAPGNRLKGPITIKGYEHLTIDVTVEKVEPERVMSFRWHPNATDVTHDYSSEPTTLVTFTLEDSDGGTLLTVVENGFDSIPLSRRAEAFRGNESGWAQQMVQIEQYLANAAK
ncbi:MAG TPA: SRPBCC family protein [Vicinamibacterales bacterium]|jgi:uncharacterized protein YndB with AHSA1/START domain|nr:SRPBCC family protein [Vicinamibacterales bacterium]